MTVAHDRRRPLRELPPVSARHALVYSILIGVFYFTAPLGKADHPMPLGLAAVVAALTVVGMMLIAGRGAKRWIHDPSRVDLVSLAVAVETVMIVFALTYYMLERSSADQFAELNTRLDSLYFTLTTVTTTGFGDVHAIGQVARAAVTLQLIFNAVFIGVLARTVSSELSRRAQERSEASPDNRPGDTDQEGP